MVRVSFFYSFIPIAFVVGTAVVLTIPYLALIVFMAISLFVVAGLALAIVAAPYMLVRAVRRRWLSQRDATPNLVPLLSPVRHQSGPVGRVR